MRQAKFFMFVGIMATIWLATSLPMNLEAAQTKAKKKHKSVGVRTLSSQNVPATIDGAEAKLVGRQTVLTYSITNKTMGRQVTIEVSVFILDQSGHIKGGEGWEQDLNLSPNSTADFPRILESNVESEDRLVLAVSRVIGQEGEFEFRVPDLVNAVKSYALASKRLPQSGRFTNVALQQQQTFCDLAIARAEAVCRCWVQSFNCNEQTRTYSFTCFPRTNCPPGTQG
jgi:cellobiose-specific phosphotransferase system component IIB